MTDVEFETARRAVGEERDHRLWLGDVFGRIEHPEVRHWAKRLSKSVRTAREYRHTARMCTPPVREMLASSSVLVSYTILREGAHADTSGIPRDESYQILKRLIAEAVEAGADHITVPDYRIALGLGPNVQDLFGPDGDDEEFREYLDEVGQGPERERLINVMTAQLRDRAQVDQAVRAALAEENATRRERRREEARLGLSASPVAADESAFAREVGAIGDQMKRVMRRYAHLKPTNLADERNEAVVTTAQATIEWFDKWLCGKCAPATTLAGSVPAQRSRRPALADA